MKCLPAFIAVLLLVQAPLFADNPELSYQRTILKSESVMDHAVFFDIQDDGRKDIVVQSNKDILVFLQKEDRTFNIKPDDTLRLKDNTFLWTICNPGPGLPPTIMTMTSSGLAMYSIQNGKFNPEPTELITTPNLFDGKSFAAPLFFDFVPDMNGDGLRDAFLFDKNTLLVFLQNATGRYRLHQKIKIPMEAEREAIIETQKTISDAISIPPLFFGDTSGDGKPDITFYYRETIGTFVQQADGYFKEHNYNLVEKKSKRKHTLLTFEIPPIIADINHDNILDIVLPFPSKGAINIYYTRAGRTDFRLPDDVKKMDGWLVGTWMIDLDNDGRMDLISAGVERFGILGGLQIWWTQKIPLQLTIYPYRGDGLAKEPASRLTFDIPFVINLTSDAISFNTTFMPNFDGDYNKDGLKDLIVKSDDKTLNVYTGRKEGGTEESPSAHIDITPPEGTAVTDPFVGDLNGDGRSDLLLRHMLWKNEQQIHTLELLLSK